MSSYDVFAKFYDQFTDDVNYKERAEYFLSLFERFDRKPTLLLDAACGSGSMSIEMSKLGIEVIGVDFSRNMLSNAVNKVYSEEQNILFLCQDITALDLYGTVDGVICTLDSINHLEDIKAVKQFFQRVSIFLEEDRLFLFDINSIYKHREVLGNHYFEIKNGDTICQWQNKYNEKDHSVEISLDFFEKNGGEYSKYSERIVEKAYSIEEIENVLTEAGFDVLAVYDDLIANAPKEKTERLVFVARKGRVWEK